MMKWKYVVLILILSGTTIACAFGGVFSTPTDQPHEPDPVTETLLTPPVISSPTTPATDLPEILLTPEIEETISSSSLLPGLKVSYFKDGNIWLWDQEQGTRKFTNSGMDYSLKFSPDGQMIAFTRQIDEFYVELWAINTDGTDERTIVNTQDLSDLAYEVRDPSAISVNPYQYTWIPGTHTIAFNIQQVYQGPGLSLLDDLRLVNVDTLDLSTLLLPGYGGEFVYSPDGNQIAISTSTAISLINSDASNWREVLVYDPVITYSEYRFYAKPVWSPDSSFLYVAIPPVDPLAEPRQSTGIWNIPTDGSSASQTGSVKSAPFFVGEVEFSPDLSRIAYPRETGEPAQNLGELHISNPDGSGDKIYISGGFVGFAGWATDSWKFNFNIDEDRRMQLGVIENSPIPFTDNPYGIHNIQWIDEQHYLFLRERDGEFDLYLGNLESEFIVLDSQVDPSRQYDFFR